MAVNHQVTNSGVTFVPQNITINQGDTVTWTFVGSHNVNGQQSVYPNNPESFFSGTAGSVSSWSFQFNIPGSYDYQCDPHLGLGMVGTITVNPVAVNSAIVITGIIDGPLPGGIPKAIEGYILADIVDASVYSVQRAGNGGGFSGTTWQFPPISGTAGDYFYLSTESTGFNSFMGFPTDTAIGSAVNVNGDDAVGLFLNSTLVDVVGDPNVDGTGTPWEYKDGWAYRIPGTGPSTTFDPAEWTFSGPDALDGETSNATAATPWPIQTYAQPSLTTPTYTISQVSSVDANGVLDSLGVLCRLTGEVFSIDYDGNNGYSFYIEDATDGMNVFSFNDVGGYQVTIGDQLEIVGTMDQFNGLAEIIPDTITIISAGNGTTSLTPAVVSTLDESTESSFIRLNGFFLANASQWPSSGSANVDITNGTDTLTMRIDSDTDIDGSVAPTDTFDVIGAGGQFDNSNPFTSGYQILPRSLADIISTGAPVAPALPIYDIAQVTGNDANGVADSLNVLCGVYGTVFTIDFDGNNG
jgi:plastocyanin